MSDAILMLAMAALLGVTIALLVKESGRRALLTLEQRAEEDQRAQHDMGVW